MNVILIFVEFDKELGIRRTALSGGGKKIRILKKSAICDRLALNGCGEYSPGELNFAVGIRSVKIKFICSRLIVVGFQIALLKNPSKSMENGQYSPEELAALLDKYGVGFRAHDDELFLSDNERLFPPYVRLGVYSHDDEESFHRR